MKIMLDISDNMRAKINVLAVHLHSDNESIIREVLNEGLDTWISVRSDSGELTNDMLDGIEFEQR